MIWTQAKPARVSGLEGAGGDAGFWNMPSTLFWGDVLAYSGWSRRLPEPYSIYDIGSVLFVLDQDEILRERVAYLPYVADSEQILNWQWVEYQNAWYIALQYDYGWRLWDTRSDAVYILETPPFAETLDGVRVDFSSDEANTLTLHFGDGRTFTLPENYQSYAIAPDGSAVAYIERDTTDQTRIAGRLMLWEHGETHSLWADEFDSWISGVTWSPLHWYVEGNPIPIADPTPVPVPTQDRG